jgi:hypothetical protein
VAQDSTFSPASQTTEYIINTITAQTAPGTTSGVSLATNTRKSSIGVFFDGGGSVIAGGASVFVVSPFSGTINAASIVAHPQGGVSVQVYRGNMRMPTVTAADSILCQPVLGAAGSGVSNTNSGTTVFTSLSSGSTTIAANDVLCFYVVSGVSVSQWANVNLEILKD